MSTKSKKRAEVRWWTKSRPIILAADSLLSRFGYRYAFTAFSHIRKGPWYIIKSEVAFNGRNVGKSWILGLWIHDGAGSDIVVTCNSPNELLQAAERLAALKAFL